MTVQKKSRLANHMLEFATVRYWQGQLNECGIKNSTSNKTDTRTVYRTRLAAFNEWLPGRIFDMRVQAVADGKIVRETSQKSFANVEELLRFGEDGFGNEKEIRKIISQYLRDPRHGNLAHSTMSGMCAAIKSYFDAHDVATNVRFNGKKRDEIEVTEEPELEIADFYKMMTANKVDLMVRAVMLVKFQAGLDSSTLADRFNFYAYQQIAKWCGADDHKAWEKDKCPIPVHLVRVKTGIKYTTFIDCDALDAIKTYLSWREERHGQRDPAGPVFLTTRNESIRREWISDAFGRLASVQFFQGAKEAGEWSPQAAPAQDAPAAQEPANGMRMRRMGRRPRARPQGQGSLHRACRAVPKEAEGRIRKGVAQDQRAVKGRIQRRRRRPRRSGREGPEGKQGQGGGAGKARQ